ncbi:hypothetical protein ACFORL_11810 [Legionella dresdenensis]|uniref:Uncharacterized protein n=1 Tax=Legionella dresdenensis TaxID=450200 RepID=A0ABV8CHQ3_9GAMM
MALISKARFNQKEKVKVELSSEVLRKIEDYCRWSQVDDISFFFEEAACYVFAKDKDWKAFQKQAKQAKRAAAAASEEN